ncbi:MAG: Sir2 family NAD-dependent protein deacetylase [Acidimicrobiales bacterium]|nr:Sir2 family NAD-dependent protein deacetylase [Acidimicrobiales bacterium]
MSNELKSSELIQHAQTLVRNASNIVVLTGAGISTASGIPDFRGPQGIWTKDPEAEKASNINFYMSDPSIRKRNWALRAEGKLWADVEPNQGHYALVKLQDSESLDMLITQNVDELHQKSGINESKVIEIHGTTRKVSCLACEYREEMELILDRVRAGEEDPDCPSCGAILKSATISFGQALIPDDLHRAEMAVRRCDLLMAIGTSLAVGPINQVVPLANQLDIPIIIINGEKTDFDHFASLVINADISETLEVVC